MCIRPSEDSIFAFGRVVPLTQESTNGSPSCCGSLFCVDPSSQLYHFTFIKMKYFVVICCVLVSVVGKEKKISLEDIERDNLKAQKTPRTIATNAPGGTPTDYGFLPVKTAADYARQQPKQYYTPPPQQQQQQYQITPQQYYYQTSTQPNPYQQYQNVQYVTDNSLAQQQYYTPQYLYLQQYTAPSTAVQSVVDPKGGLQYIMYVPTYVPKAEQTQNYENVVYTNDDIQQSYVPETQYVTKYVTVPKQEVKPSIQYAPEVPPQQQTEKPRLFTVKQQPKSLLDSYIPSILQIQYYKQQQQAQANAIQQQSSKQVSTPAVGKIEYAKTNNRPTQTQHNSAESVINYNYQVPSTYHQ